MNMKDIYGKLTIRVEERDEYNKVVKASTFSLSNIAIEDAEDTAADYEAMLRNMHGFRNYSITRTFRF